MRARETGLRTAALCLTLLLLLELAGGPRRASADDPPPAAEEVVFVVHPENGTRRLSAAELREILVGSRTFWADGRAIVLVLPPQKSVEQAELLRHIGLDDRAFNRLWKEKLFRGEVTSLPTVATSPARALTAVSKNRGAIAPARRAAAEQAKVGVLEIAP